MKRYLIFTLLLIPIFHIYSTGVERAEIEIVPLYISINNDIICKIRIMMDAQDAGATIYTKFGFLVYNNKGLWDETYYYVLESKTKHDAKYDEQFEYQTLYNNNEFDQISDFITIKEKYKIKSKIEKIDDVRVNLLDYNIDIYSRGFNNNFRVRTLDGYNGYLESTIIYYYYKSDGIYMIRNIDTFYDKRKTGAKFILPNYYMHPDGKVTNFNYSYSIDGVLLLKE